MVAITADHQPLEFTDVRQTTIGANGKIATCRFDLTRRQFNIIGAQSLFNIGHGDTVRCHASSIQPDTHGITTLATNKHIGNTIKHGKAVNQITLGKVTEFFRCQCCAGQGDPDNRPRIGIGFGNHRRIRIFRQSAQHPRNRVTDIVSGSIHIPAKVEFNRSAGGANATARLDALNTFNAADCRFYNLDNLGIDNFRCRTAVIYRYGHFRRVNIRILPDR